MEPSVSVVIDAYNYGRFIERAVESAIEQDLAESRREIIVVDDGSTDDTCERVSKFGSRVRYLHKPNGGQASAFNAGVLAAQGDIVCFLDADDRYYPSRLSDVLAVFVGREDVGLVFNRYDIVNEQGDILARSVPKRLYQGDLSGRVLLGYVTGSPSSGISARRELLLRNLVPETLFRVSADYFYLNILPLQTRVGVVHRSLHAYLHHGQNLYLARPSEVQIRIHAAQRGAIWEDAATRLGKHFVRGVHSYDYLGREAPTGARVRAFARDAKGAISVRAPVGLKAWSVSKAAAYLLLPRSLYKRLKVMWDHERVNP